jgi:hypothetical protein
MKKYSRIAILVMMMMGCKESYNPPAIKAVNSYLVVEGFINPSADSTVIRLSRTVNLSANITTNPELFAQVTVEGDNNTTYNIREIGSGKYAAPGLMLDVSHKYRLRITTSNNEQYLSSFETPLNTPPIDSVGFNMQNTAQNTGILIYTSTHDPAGLVKYYRWDYAETWQFNSRYNSEFITDGKEIVPRTADQNIYYCFGSDSSSTIVLGSSAGLSKAIIYQNPIIQIASTSEKVETKYSIEVNQYALSGDAYNFWVNLKKNTEQLGSIFDAQPSNINGNIQCITNPAEPVIGYITVSNVQRKRIFISNGQLPITWRPTYPYDCMIDTNWFSAPGTGQNEVQENLVQLGSADIPTAAFYKSSSPSPKGYLSSDIDCIDCTIRGSKITPVFWK